MAAQLFGKCSEKAHLVLFREGADVVLEGVCHPAILGPDIAASTQPMMSITSTLITCSSTAAGLNSDGHAARYRLRKAAADSCDHDLRSRIFT